MNIGMNNNAEDMNKMVNANPFDVEGTSVMETTSNVHQEGDIFGEFEMGTEEMMALAKKATRSGTSLTPDRQKIVDRFGKLKAGQTFLVPVPAGEDAKDYRSSIHNMLTAQGKKNRQVLVFPGTNKLIIGIDPKK